MNLILASSSPSRQKLLSSLGIPFKTVPHSVNEEEYQNRIQSPELLCSTLARKKVESIDLKNVFILGVDQMAHLNGKLIGKPGNREKALETLLFLQGKTHELVSALCLKKPDGSFFEETLIHKMSMRPLTKKQIEFYLDKDQPYSCAGSYRVESLGLALFEKIDSPDFNAIIGIPLISLFNELFRISIDFLNS